MSSITNPHDLCKFREAEDYVMWLDKNVGRNVKCATGNILLHYKFNRGEYDRVMYYTIPSSKEIFFYTPQEYDFVGVSHTVEDTYSFLHRLLGGEFANNYSFDY